MPVEKGCASSSLIPLVSGRTYRLSDNPMGITRFCLSFEKEDEACLYYTNAQGDKVLLAGLQKNVFTYFPQTGWSDGVGSVPAPGHRYVAAISGGWPVPFQFRMKVQFIDDYLGTLDMIFGFTEDGKKVTVQMVKACEDFANEYQGWATGMRVDADE